MLTKNYYDILGVNKNASENEIKTAFRTLSKKFHPDIGGDSEKFKEISEAYSVLSKEDKRREYDNGGLRNFGPAPSHFSNAFANFFNMGQHFRRPDPLAPKKGRTIVLEHEVSLGTLLFGGEIDINLSFEDVCIECGGRGAKNVSVCDTCNGSGQITESKSGNGMLFMASSTCPNCRGRGFSGKDICNSCHGSGVVNNTKIVVVEVQKNSKDGCTLCALGEGGSGLNGGSPGDVLIRLTMKYPDIEMLTDKEKNILRKIWLYSAGHSLVYTVG